MLFVLCAPLAAVFALFLKGHYLCLVEDGLKETPRQFRK